jgi:hypothetical protein
MQTYFFDEDNWDAAVTVRYIATGETLFSEDICVATETRDGGITEGDQCTFPFQYGGVTYTKEGGCPPIETISPFILDQDRGKLWCATGDGR